MKKIDFCNDGKYGDGVVLFRWRIAFKWNQLIQRTEKVSSYYKLFIFSSIQFALL